MSFHNDDLLRQISSTARRKRFLNTSKLYSWKIGTWLKMYFSLSKGKLGANRSGIWRIMTFNCSSAGHPAFQWRVMVANQRRSFSSENAKSPKLKSKISNNLFLYKELKFVGRQSKKAFKYFQQSEKRRRLLRRGLVRPLDEVEGLWLWSSVVPSGGHVSSSALCPTSFNRWIETRF